MEVEESQERESIMVNLIKMHYITHMKVSQRSPLLCVINNANKIKSHLHCLIHILTEEPVNFSTRPDLLQHRGI